MNSMITSLQKAIKHDGVFVPMVAHRNSPMLPMPIAGKASPTEQDAIDRARLALSTGSFGQLAWVVSKAGVTEVVR